MSKARIGSKDKVTYEEVGIKNLTLDSPVPQAERLENAQLSRKPKSLEKKIENDNLKDSSCDSQSIPCNQLGFLSPNVTNKRSNVDNMTKSGRNVKGKFVDV